MDNIILIGMPGCGKSTLGVVLARKLGYGYLDTDSFISQREKSTLQDIIDKRGLNYFLDIESSVGSEIVCDRVIIATGGSMIMSEKAMDNLKSLGKVIYINVPIDELKRRLGNFSDRGIAIKNGETLDDILKKRTPYYNKYADLVVDYKDGNSLEETVNDIIEHL
ncbi:MAG: shikimate kinase [Ruminococcus sp.]|jgi:shikimate kinase|nr:shikimate kinase [Ruminococcus sp.]